MPAPTIQSQAPLEGEKNKASFVDRELIVRAWTAKQVRDGKVPAHKEQTFWHLHATIIWSS